MTAALSEALPNGSSMPSCSDNQPSIEVAGEEARSYGKPFSGEPVVISCELEREVENESGI